MAELLDFEVTVRYKGVTTVKVVIEREPGVYGVCISRIIDFSFAEFEDFEFYTMEKVLTKVPELYPWVAND